MNNVWKDAELFLHLIVNLIMKKDFLLVIAIFLVNGFVLSSDAFAGPGNDGTKTTPGTNNSGGTGNSSNSSASTTTSSTTTTNTTPASSTSTSTIESDEWVIIEVVEQPAGSTQTQGQVTVEKKNISQVTVTHVEVKSCQQNTTPVELIPILRDLTNGSNRHVYVTEENGKKIWYISPEVQQNQGSTTDNNTMVMPILFQIKI